MYKNGQPWVGKPLTDIVFILLPPFFSLLIIILFPRLFQNNKEMPDIGWFVLVLLIDVAHVYSTLYRTYFDPASLRERRSLLWTIPFVGFVGGVLLYSISSLLFWRILAYVAVFHFVRQQYGFMRVYSRKEPVGTFSANVDKVTIYTAALYPLLYWHLSGPRNFNWFIEGDFFYYESRLLLLLTTVVYGVIMTTYLVKEVSGWIKHRRINIPKFSVIMGTIVSWYFGIVYFNGDLAFTLLNVVSHGIPYMALVWLYGKKQYTKKEGGNRFLQAVFSRYGVVLFLLVIFLLAYIEEGLWDYAVWQEHGSLFNGLKAGFTPNEKLLAFLVPLLALPQITHYILDGFIWKIGKEESVHLHEGRRE